MKNQRKNFQILDIEIIVEYAKEIEEPLRENYTSDEDYQEAMTEYEECEKGWIWFYDEVGSGHVHPAEPNGFFPHDTWEDALKDAIYFYQEAEHKTINMDEIMALCMVQTTYTNIDERYGDAYPVTIADYIELNPEGDFEERTDGIYEDGEQIAEITS